MAKVSNLSQQPVEVNPVSAPTGSGDVWSGLGAGGYGALNSVLMGLPDLLVRTAGGSETYKKLKDFKEQNKTASTIGDIAGLGASFLIPGGALLKGVQLGTKALGAGKIAETLGKGAEFLGASGGKLGEQALRGAGQAAEQAIPRAITESVANDQPVDPASVAAQVGLGAAGGAILGKLAPLLGKTAATGADEVGKTVEDAILSGADVGTRVVKTALNQTARQYDLNRYGNFFNNADEFKAGLSKFITDNNLGDKLTREAFIEDNGPLWQAVAEKFNTSPLKIGTPEFTQQFLANPKIAELISDPNIGVEGVQKIAQKMVGGIADAKTGGIVNDFNQAKRYLNDQISKYSKISPATPEALDQTEAGLRIASALKQSIDEHALSLDPAFATLKANYPYVQALKIASGLEKIKVENPLREGSDTFQKLATNAALGGTLGVGASGEDDKLAGGVTGALAGAVGIPFATRALSKIGTQALGGGAGALSKLGEKLKPLADRLNLPEIGQAVEQNAARIGAVTPPIVASGMEQPAPEQIPEIPEAPVEAPVEPQGVPVSTEPPAPQGPPPPAFVNNKQFQSVLAAKLRQIYVSNYSDMPEDKFMAAVARRTNNFNDMDQVAKFLFPGDNSQKNAFLTQWKNYQLVKDIDINRAVEAGGILAGLPGTPFKEQAEQLDTLKSIALSNVTDGDAAKITSTLEKQWNNDIEQLRNSRGVGVGPREVSPALLATFAQKWGLDFKNLADLGVK